MSLFSYADDSFLACCSSCWFWILNTLCFVKWNCSVFLKFSKGKYICIKFHKEIGLFSWLVSLLVHEHRALGVVVLHHLLDLILEEIHVKRASLPKTMVSHCEPLFPELDFHVDHSLVLLVDVSDQLLVLFWSYVH